MFWKFTQFVSGFFLYLNIVQDYKWSLIYLFTTSLAEQNNRIFSKII